jgi:hypothetical protein
MHVKTHTHTYSPTHTHTHTHINTDTHKHKHKHRHTHTHTHSLSHTLSPIYSPPPPLPYSTIRRNTPSCLDSKIHHNNLLNNILAKIEANFAGVSTDPLVLPFPSSLLSTLLPLPPYNMLSGFYDSTIPIRGTMFLGGGG